MKQYLLTVEQIENYKKYLWKEERSCGTVEKYIRDISGFAYWLKGRAVTKEITAEWKAHLVNNGYAPVTVNAMLSALNGLFRFMGWDECRVKFLKIQRQLFREHSKELTKDEYRRLVTTAESMGKDRLALLTETICATGIRVSEVRYITVEAVRCGRAEISLKGKIRVILISSKLCRKLQKYALKEKIASGAIFCTKSGKEMDRRQIWAELKGLCTHAEVKPSKVFPHNLRHLFATAFYTSCKDIVRLADIMGHSSIETTRIYLVTSGEEHQKQLDRMQLVL